MNTKNNTNFWWRVVIEILSWTTASSCRRHNLTMFASYFPPSTSHEWMNRVRYRTGTTHPQNESHQWCFSIEFILFSLRLSVWSRLRASRLVLLLPTMHTIRRFSRPAHKCILLPRFILIFFFILFQFRSILSEWKLDKKRKYLFKIIR